MAGAGYKNFNAGDVLTSADVDTYLMEQSIMVFAGTAARASAISSPSEGMFTYLSDTNTLQYYTGTAWVDSYSATNGAAVTNRNLIYNGAMQVAQRGTSVTGITGNDYRTSDRWRFNVASTGTWTMSVENDAPTGSGLRKSAKVLVTTGTASPTFCNFVQVLEGQDVQRIAKGTASAQQLTLSFWVKSNVTGTYIAELYDEDNNRGVSAAYTISASGTWEKKTITFPADTTGAFDNDNAASLHLNFGLAFGSAQTSGTLQTTWATLVSANRYVGQVNVAAATNNYWQVTGVQLEVGPVATSFEFKSFGQELRECQRYYWRSVHDAAFLNVGFGVATSTTDSSIFVQNPVPMRVAPTAVEFAFLRSADQVNDYGAPSAVTLNSFINGRLVAGLSVTDTGYTQYRPMALQHNNNSGSYLGLSAEL